MKSWNLFVASLGFVLLLGAASIFSLGCTTVVRTAPPPDQVEVIGVAPRADAVWIGGFWAHRHGNWVWVPGHWERGPHHGAHWMPGHWQHGPRGWHYVPGHWR